jgi:hypothetical protein
MNYASFFCQYKGLLTCENEYIIDSQAIFGH